MPKPILLMLGFLLAAACATEVEQAPVCEHYVECIRSLDELAGVETDLDRFDPGGACWGSEEQGKICIRACTRGLEWENERRTDAPEACR